MKPITGKQGPDGSGGADDQGTRPGGGLFTNRRRARPPRRGGDGGGRMFSSPAWKGVGVALGGLALGYLLATVVMFPAAAQSSGLVTAPDVLGQDATAARASLADLGLGVEGMDTIQHPRAAAGEVLGQNPLPGQLVAMDGSVRLTISAGPVQLPVPAVVGRQLDQALDLLEGAGFTFAADSVESDEPAGSVVGASPEPGTRVALPHLVQLHVSLGPPTVTLPRLIGLDEAAALQMLDSLGLEVDDVEERFRFGLDQGKVIEQEPAAGVEVEHGSVVRLVVGRRGGG